VSAGDTGAPGEPPGAPPGGRRAGPGPAFRRLTCAPRRS
jgi:hypothetical protein